MSLIGVLSLTTAFAATALSICFLLATQLVNNKAKKASKQDKEELGHKAHSLAQLGYFFTMATALSLVVACTVLVYCFLTGDISLEYVVRYHSNSTSSLRPLYDLAGLWAGREGSLLFWACLISMFAALMALLHIKTRKELDNMALLVMQIVMLGFVALLLFSQSNMPFHPLDARFININPIDGSFSLKTFAQVAETLPGEGRPPFEAALLDGVASLGGRALNPYWVTGSSPLLEHWAMAIHPPTLFVGYAGLTVPFAYAIAALIVNDPSKKWVERSTRLTLFSWIMLTAGVGLGAVWAYEELTFGGYWAWDPVENASLLPWILATALLHNFTVYRQRGAFKRWAIMCACLTLAFVILGTFITRSGVIKNSVHVFAGDTVSLYLFVALMGLSIIAGAVGLAIRWRSFSDKGDAADLGDSFFSKGVAYYFNNILLVGTAFILAYLTLSTALPPPLPFAGAVFTSVTYNSIAAPLTFFYCAIMALCPLLSWAKTDARKFFKKALFPAIGALLLFALLVVYFLLHLMPSYEVVVATEGNGNTFAADRLNVGPAPYYYALTLVGFFVASLLFFNSLYMLVRFANRCFGLGKKIKELTSDAGESAKAIEGTKADEVDKATKRRFSNLPWAAPLGGFIAHLAMAVILIGLIGSSMYVTDSSMYSGDKEEDPFELSIYLGKDLDKNVAMNEIQLGDYCLVYDAEKATEAEVLPHINGKGLLSLPLDVYKKSSKYHVKTVLPLAIYTEDTKRSVGAISPSFQPSEIANQSRVFPAVKRMLLEDVFVTYDNWHYEANEYGVYLKVSVRVFVNPLVSFVWIGFGLLLVGATIAFIGRRGNSVCDDD